MVVLKALRTAAGAVRRNPVILLVTAVVALLQLPSMMAQSVDPLVGSVVSLAFSGLLFLLTPFIQGGLIAMASEGLGGDAGIDTFAAAGKENYVSLLAAYALLVGVNLVIGTVVVLPLVFVGIFMLGGAAPVGRVVLLILGLLILLGVLAYLLLAFFVQFYGHAIVLDGQGIVDGFRRSIGLVRKNLASTVGYTALAVAVGGLFGVVIGAGSLALSPRTLAALDLPAISTAGQAAIAAVVVVATAAFSAILLTFSVAFYTEISGRERAAAV